MNNVPMVIKIQILEWEIKRFLIYSGSSVDVLYWDVFKRLKLDPDDHQLLRVSLVDFLYRVVPSEGLYQSQSGVKIKGGH